MAKSRPKTYEAVVGKLPAMPGVDPERRDAVEAAQSQIKAPLTDEERMTGSGENPLAILRRIEADMALLLTAQKRWMAHGGHGLTSAPLGYAWARCRAIRDAIDAHGSAMGLLVDAYQWLMVDAMKAEGLDGLRLEGIGGISKWQEPYAKVEDPDLFRRWCLAPKDVWFHCKASPVQHSADEFGRLSCADGGPFLEGGGEIAKKLGLMWGVTNALTKERLLHGEPEPPGVVAYAQTKVRLG